MALIPIKKTAVKLIGESRTQVEAEAAAWIVKRGDDGWTPEDGAKLSAWLEASASHCVAFARLDSAWQEAARLKALNAGAPKGAVPTPGHLVPVAARAQSVDSTVLTAHSDVPARAQSTLSPRRPIFLRAIAAGVLLAAMGSGTWLLLPRGSAYQTEVGGLEAVPMGDGSAVTLNTDSRIRVNLTETERLVELERGEAFFDVAADPSRPFVVAAGGERVVAIGTQFSVRRGEQGLRVVVIEGRVRLESEAGGGPSIAPAELGAGDTAHSGEEGVLVQQKPMAEVSAALSWRKGFLVFHETPLAEAVREFNRYNVQHVVVEGESIGNLLIDGNFRATNVQAFIRLVEQGFPVSVERIDDRIVVRAKQQLRSNN